MHETLQRRICRVAFLMLCVLPTVALAGWVGARHLPGRHGGMLALLGRQLGVRISIERISTPKPGEWRLAGVQIFDPETATQIAALDSFAFRNDTGQLIGRGGELVVSDPVIAAERLAPLLRGDWPIGVQSQFDRLTLPLAPAAPVMWDNVTISLASGPSDSRQLEVTTTTDDAHLLAERVRNEVRPRTRLRLDTGQQAIAWAWLRRQPTDGTTFAGKCDASYTAGTADERFTGILANFHLDTLLGADSGLSLHSEVSVQLETLRMSNGRVVELRADASTAAGAASRHLVLAAIQHLGCQATTLLRERWPHGPIAFDNIAFRMEMDSSGVAINSPSSKPHRGVLASADGPLLLAPTGSRASLESLLHLVAPTAERYHPSAPQAVELARRLPLATTTR